MKRWPELKERLLDLADTLRDHGIAWKPFVELGAEVRRGSRIPSDVVAEMRGLLGDLRAIRPTPAEHEVASFVLRCRELARELPEKSGDFEALAERSQRQRTALWEDRELLLAEVMDVPVWGTIRFVEPGEPGEYELPAFSDLPADDLHGRTEPTAELGFMALWRLVLAWESGALGEESERRVDAPSRGRRSPRP